MGRRRLPARLLRRIRPATMVEAERKRIAHQLLAEVRRLERELTDSKRSLGVAVEAADTSLTDIYRVGGVVAALILGYSGDVSRFPAKHHYAAYNGTAPIEASSGVRKRHRLNPRGNRMLNHALHLIAITQLRYPTTEGYAYYQRTELGATRHHNFNIECMLRRICSLELERGHPNQERSRGAAISCHAQGEGGNAGVVR